MRLSYIVHAAFVAALVRALVTPSWPGVALALVGAALLVFDRIDVTIGSLTPRVDKVEATAKDLATDLEQVKAKLVQIGNRGVR